MSDYLWPHGLQHTRFPCPLLSPGVCSNSCPLSQQCHPTISSSVAPSSSCPHQHLFQHQGLFQWVGSSHQVAKVLELFLPMDIQGWFLLGLTGWIFLQSKGLSRVSSPTLHWYNYQKQDVFKKLFWPRSKNAIYSEWVNCLIHVLIFVKNIFLMLSHMSNR